MQIDFHHTLTYIAARLAGFPHRQSSIIAYSSQYVDDATNSGVIRFDNDALYRRISSAHKMLDYRNSDELANHRVWVPFHFLPGNGGVPAGENPKGTFINKLICTPDSHVARDMLRACVADHDKPYALHRLGITMHVYADTWAHMGFAGVNHRVNEVNHLKCNNKRLEKSFFQKILGFFISETFPLGHGAALSYPDLPTLVWEYKNGLNKKIKRNNLNLFIEAVEQMCRAMQAFRAKDLAMDLESMPGLPENDKKKIVSLLRSTKQKSGDDRHRIWLKEIKKGSFSFGPQDLKYIPKGRGSWKHQSIGQLKAADTGHEVFVFKKSFMNSNWKMFHDALQAHRFDILYDVLPRYGICAA